MSYDDNFKRHAKFNKNVESSNLTNDEFAKHEPVQAQPLEVKVYGNNFDKALRTFRALVQKERVLSAYKENQSYEKPSDKKRRKRNEMKRKRLELDLKVEEKSPNKRFKKEVVSE